MSELESGRPRQRRVPDICDVLLGSAGALGAATFSFPKPAFAQAEPIKVGRQSSVGGLRPAAQRARHTGRGSVVVLSRDCREASRARRRAQRLATTNVDGGAGTGPPPASVRAS